MVLMLVCLVLLLGLVRCLMDNRLLMLRRQGLRLSLRLLLLCCHRLRQLRVVHLRGLLLLFRSDRGEHDRSSP